MRDITPLLNEAKSLARNDLIVIVHDDVYLPHGFEKKLMARVKLLDVKGPWGVLGPTGFQKKVFNKRKKERKRSPLASYNSITSSDRHHVGVVLCFLSLDMS
eukprot:TRINITY_DN7582_c0_g1_i1.p1 TRINITY_DN7582_c0_g1~~TRINITY_DN7582_c0_g1_i1.p1  ORF type:complete len:102 (+),score=26.76 TRINITY_DN7582_c0_g1_i1:748-1053(+)